MSSCVLQYLSKHAVNFPLDIFAKRENSTSNSTSLHNNMCILLYVKLIWCSGITYIYGQLEEGGLGIYAFFYM